MPRYAKEFIAEIKSRLSVSEVVGKFVKLTKRGNEYIGLSPFKNEKTPSFTVNDEKEFYHCFSSAEHGDIFSFLMKHKNMTYPESIEYLAQQAGMNIERGMIKDPNFVERDYSKLRNLMFECCKYYQFLLEESTVAQKYLDKRGLNYDTVKTFELGYASKGSNDLYNYLLKKGFSIDDALTLGIVKNSKNKTGEFYDFFRSRLIFPIKDSKSNVIAFGGRALDNSNIKYINSSDSPIFKKSYQLFNLDIATRDNRKIKDLIIVEGYMDVISLHKNDFKSCVAPLGTALTKYQLQKAWKVCESPIIMFDGDEAGQKAAQRASLLAINNLMPDLSLRICILPSDCDPDDFLNINKSNDLEDLIRKSLSLSEFIWQTELTKEDISTPEKKAGFEKRLKDICSQISNQTIKNYYIKYYREKLNDFGGTLSDFNYSGYKKNNKGVSKEVFLSDRANDKVHVSVVREKIIILAIIENPTLMLKYSEEIGKIRFNDKQLSNLISKIIELSSSMGDKDLENIDLKSYLVDQGLNQEIKYIYQLKLINTYQSIIQNNIEVVEKSFRELLSLQSNLVEKVDLSSALDSLEENMDQKSFENFIKIKNETINN